MVVFLIFRVDGMTSFAGDFLLPEKRRFIKR